MGLKLALESTHGVSNLRAKTRYEKITKVFARRFFTLATEI